MATEHIIYALYVIPLLISLNSYRETIQVYEQLPDKLPMNFDFKGKVNRCLSKNWFSAYLMPNIGLMTTLMMCGMLFFINSETGPMPDGYNLAFWFFNFSMVYLFYQSQEGILRFSLDISHYPNQSCLDSSKNIWPSFLKGFILLGFSCVVLVSLLFIDTEPKINEAVFCSNIENKQAIDVRDQFSQQDQKIFLLLSLNNIKGEHIIRTEWFNPEGKQYFKYEYKTHHKILAKRLAQWSYIKPYSQQVFMTGQWYTDVYIDGKKVLTKEFTISF